MNDSVTAPAADAARDRMLRKLVAEVTDGLRHGYFEFHVGCEIVGHDRRQVTLRAGKNHRFLIPGGECTVSASVIPAIGTPAETLFQTQHIVPMASARQAQTGSTGLEPRVAHGERH
jgi:hypothetical protein